MGCHQTGHRSRCFHRLRSKALLIQIHYISYLFVRIKKNRKAVQNVEELSAKMYLVGLAGTNQTIQGC